MFSPKLKLVPLVLLAACADQPVSPVAEHDGPSLQVSQGGVVHRVTVGGPDICSGIGARPGCDANLSVIALEMADGSVSGQWVDIWSPGGGSENAMHATVTCLEINTITQPAGTFQQAWIGGVLTRPLALAGHPVMLRVRDRGTSANDPIDAVSRSIVDPQDEPEHFSTDCHAMPPMGLTRPPQGQVMIR